MSYDFLIEMGWKSAVIAGGALLLAALLRSRAAADRGAVLKVAVALLLALPAIALFAPAFEIETPAPATAPVTTALVPAAVDAVASEPALAATAVEAASGNWDDPSLIFFLLYGGGVAMVGGRLLAGLWTLRCWTRGAREVDSPEWRAALARSGGDSLGVRLLVSEDASSPLSWGWRRPVVLIDRDTLRAPEEADAILAHEVAHVSRRDWPSLILSRLAVALFWFNPLVWRLDREVAQQAEEAADSDAAAAVEPARYAQTLLDWARLGGPSALPANAIAAGEPGLSKRVKAILDGRVERRSGSFWAVAAMLGCAAFAAPVAALDFVEGAPEAPPALAALPAPAAPIAPVPPVPSTPRVAPAPHAPLAPIAVRPPRVPAPPALPHAAVAAAARASAHAAAAAQASARPYVDEAAIEAQVAAAVAEAARATEARTAEIGRHVERAVEAAMAGIAAGARGMENGAVGMERGAANMLAEARRLRDHAYREEQIREHAARGKRLTHEDLLEAAEGMEEGAEGMREGAREMREAAEEMRKGKHD